MARGVVDVQEDRVEATLRLAGIEASTRRHGKEVVVDQADAWRCGHSCRDEATLVPLDHGCQSLHDEQ